MEGWSYDSELLEFLRRIVECIDGGRFDKLGNLFSRVRRLRRRGVKVDLGLSELVLEAFVRAALNCIENGDYGNVQLTLSEFDDFLEIFNQPIGEESAYRIWDAFNRKISEYIKSGKYDVAEEWMEAFKQFLENFELTTDENLVSKLADSYNTLIESYIDAKEAQKADKIKELLEEIKEWTKPPKERTMEKD
ncbi:MAG: hypothetical protein QW279_04470, partial [Candidatus Jordarchaeaceae archaeon]